MGVGSALGKFFSSNGGGETSSPLVADSEVTIPWLKRYKEGQRAKREAFLDKFGFGPKSLARRAEIQRKLGEAVARTEDQVADQLLQGYILEITALISDKEEAEGVEFGDQIPGLVANELIGVVKHEYAGRLLESKRDLFRTMTADAGWAVNEFAGKGKRVEQPGAGADETQPKPFFVLEAERGNLDFDARTMANLARFVNQVQSGERQVRRDLSGPNPRIRSEVMANPTLRQLSQDQRELAADVIMALAEKYQIGAKDEAVKLYMAAKR